VNCEQANQIPIVQILDTLGHQPKRKASNYYKYLSPFRPERTASFTVYLATNHWHDFGTEEGGRAVDVVIKHLQQQGEAHTIPDALRWIGNMQGDKPLIRSVPVECHTPKDSNLILKATYNVKHPALIQYMQHRGIPEILTQSYLKELRLYNKESKKSFFALGFQNEAKGYDFRNKFLKGCIGPKDISFIRGTKEHQDKIHLFEGGTDFLSRLRIKGVKRLEDDSIVLHSLAMLKKAAPFIQNYTYKTVFTWLDNDKSGERATANVSDFCKTQNDLMHKPMSHQYRDHKDLNDFLVAKLSLKNRGIQ